MFGAAKQVMDLHSEDAQMAAAQCAGLALPQDDLFNFNFWRQVTRAAYQLQRQKLMAGEVRIRNPGRMKPSASRPAHLTAPGWRNTIQKVSLGNLTAKQTGLALVMLAG